MNKPKHHTDKSTAAAEKTSPLKPTPNPTESEYHLSPHDAAAAAPADESVTGEEDPGAGLEFLVKK
jgi:hypothetical protein